MSSSRESNLKLYSLGIVAVTKERGSDAIKVTPIEELTMTNKKLSEEKSNYKVEVPDAKGVSRSSEVESDIMMVAKWIPFGHSNRLTAPDVVQGETVVLFRFGDTDEYYWTTIFREAKLRRLETVNYGYSNIPGGMVAFDKETSYWFEISTEDKHVKLHTSKNDGEPFEYDITLDTGNGKLLIDDNIGNSIELNSAENTITAIANSHILLKAPLVTIEAELTHITGNCKIDGYLVVEKKTTTGSLTVVSDSAIGGNELVSGNSEIHGELTTSSAVVNGKLTAGSVNAGGEIIAGGEVHGTNI